MSQNKKVKNKYMVILRRLLLIFLGLLLGISIYIVNAQSLVRTELPMPFGTGVAVVLSGSMEPTLQVGDFLIVKKAENYTEGDIVVYQNRNELIVHRIISIDGENYITKGDANNTEDEPITLDKIEGVVISHIPYIGNIFNILRTPLGIIALLALAIILIESSFKKEKQMGDKKLEDIKKEIRRLKDEQTKDKKD